MDITPTDLDYPFYTFSNSIPDDCEDLSFAYHVIFHELGDVNSITAICNDIPCDCCPFTCKEGVGRHTILTDFARKHFPEHQI